MNHKNRLKQKQKIKMSHIVGFLLQTNQPTNHYRAHNYKMCCYFCFFLVCFQMRSKTLHSNHQSTISITTLQNNKLCKRIFKCVKCGMAKSNQCSILILITCVCMCMFFLSSPLYFETIITKIEAIITVIHHNNSNNVCGSTNRSLYKFLYFFPASSFTAAATVVVVDVVATTPISRPFNRINTRHKNVHTQH